MGNGAIDSNQIFGAVVAIGPGGDGFPSASPASFVPLAETAFGLSFFTADVSVPLAVTIPAGDYALIFGPEPFQCDCRASLPTTNNLTPRKLPISLATSRHLEARDFGSDISSPITCDLRLMEMQSPKPSTRGSALGFAALVALGGDGVRRRRVPAATIRVLVDETVGAAHERFPDIRSIDGASRRESLWR